MKPEEIIAHQMMDCIMEGIDRPYMKRPYTNSEKITILENLIISLQVEKSNINYDS